MMGVAGSDHAADGMHRRLQHHAVLRGADVGAPQTGLPRSPCGSTNSPILSLSRANPFETSADQILSTLDDLQFGFRLILPLACARDATNCARSPLSPGGVALQRGHPRNLQPRC